MSAPTTQRVRIEVGDFAEGTMREVPFPAPDSTSKILLSKVGGKVFATSSKCTHYGAPLIKGILSCEGQGRLVCPWHGAAFNVCTGDIEDAPGVGSLQSFRVEVDGEAVYVTAPEDVVSFRPPAPVPASASQDKLANRVLIIGGGGGAAHAIEGLREQGYQGSIKVLSKEPYLPIDRTKLSKALVSDPSKVALRNGAFYAGLNVEFVLNVDATKIDFEGKSVHLADGAKHEYDHLIVATGSTPNRIPVKGSGLKGIFVMRTVEDTAAIDAALGHDETVKKNVVIIGSSFIGLESALACAKRASVTVVGMDKVPFEAILGSAVGAGIQKYHESQGIKFHLSASLDHFQPSTYSNDDVGHVLLKDGTSIPADLVILGVGVRPATQVLKDSGLELEKDGSVVVDGGLRIKAIAQGNVYAIGDIAKYPEKTTGKLVRVEHWNVASNHARAVAKTIAGKGDSHFDKVAVFWSAQGQQLRYAAGSSSGAKEWDDVIVQGTPDSLKFVAFYCKGDEVVAIASMQSDPIVAHCSELFRLGRMVTKSAIQQGANPLEIKLLA